MPTRTTTRKTKKATTNGRVRTARPRLAKLPTAMGPDDVEELQRRFLVKQMAERDYLELVRGLTRRYKLPPRWTIDFGTRLVSLPEESDG